MVNRGLEGHVVAPLTLAATNRRGQLHVHDRLVVGTTRCAGIPGQHLGGSIPSPLNCRTTGSQTRRPIQADGQTILAIDVADRDLAACSHAVSGITAA
ncbi:hypothetical protein D3C79_933570 [compost metagenome]